ncbi:hypothetical protein H0H81_010852 [Sphagnurus paluster]|uniref:F-box domain-containing protein n=1 Tax=Sphagnurus paluster TaxID=117069 RepID=A0A9P7GIX5_9AGAR|nr:hypothetical protein H0H81_010852 [Sphagnurus paluster]
MAMGHKSPLPSLFLNRDTESLDAHYRYRYLNEFSKALSGEVRILLDEVGKLRDERRSLHEIAELMNLKTKHGAGGEYAPDWRPKIEEPPPPPPAIEDVPQAQSRPGWRVVHKRPERKPRPPRSSTTPAPPPMQQIVEPPRPEMPAWAQWRPNFAPFSQNDLAILKARAAEKRIEICPRVGPLFSALVCKKFGLMDSHKKPTGSSISSIIHSLTRSNHQPSNLQAQVLINMRDEQETEARNIETEWTRLLLQMNDLVEEMKAVKKLGEEKQNLALSYRFLLSSVRRLPPEVLVQIFDFLLPGETESLPPPGENASSPLGLSHVCSSWRTAIIGHSRFWRRLCLNFDDLGRGASYPELISTWFSRMSNKTLLQFSFCGALPSEHPSPILNKMVYSIMTFMPRMEYLSFVLDSPEALAPLLSLPGGRAPFLDTLAIILTSRPYYNIYRDLPPVKILENAPLLKTVGLRGMYRDVISDSVHFPMPWSQLTCLKFQDAIPLGIFSQIIVQCTQLEESWLSVCSDLSGIDEETLDQFYGSESDSDSDNAPTAQPPQDLLLREQMAIIPKSSIVLPSLRYLKLSIEGKHTTRMTGRLFDKLKFPALKTLQLMGEPCGGFPIEMIMPVIEPSLPFIQELSLAFLDSQMEVIDLIASCPQLVTLAIRIWSEDDIPLLKLLQESPAPLACITSFALGSQLIDHRYMLFLTGQFFACVEKWAERAPHRKVLKKACFHLCKDDETSSSEEQAALKVLENVEARLGRIGLEDDFRWEARLIDSYTNLVTEGVTPYEIV